MDYKSRDMCLRMNVASKIYPDEVEWLCLRVHAHKNLLELGIIDDRSYFSLAKLIGRENDNQLINLTEDEKHILRLLAGPNAYAIYKMLLIKQAR